MRMLPRRFPTGITAGCRGLFALGIVAALTTCSVDTLTFELPPVMIGGTVTGLDGAGLMLTNNGGDDLAITGDGAFMFETPVERGTSYALAVKIQPSSPTQSCTITNGSGTAGDADVTDIQVTCRTGTFTIGGMVTGVVGSGLVLQNNGGDDLAITADGRFEFSAPMASGATFDVTVRTQPSGPTQTCTVAGGTGTVGGGDVTSVAVNCMTDRYMIGGTISGLAGGTVTLQNNGGDGLDVTSNGTFAFPTPVPSGSNYVVTVRTQPSGPPQTCVVTAGTGTVTNADVTDVVLTCTTNGYSIGGTVTGLASGNSITLRNNGGDDLVRTGDGPFEFSTAVLSGQMYAVTLVASPTSPISQTCAVTNGSGTVGSGPVTDVQVTCTTNTFTVGGTVTGLAGAGLVLQNNSGDDLQISANGDFTFPTPVASGQPYAVTVAANPTTPVSQTCRVTNGGGTVGGGPVTNVQVTCTTNAFAIRGMLTGLAGGHSLTLRNNGGNDLNLNTNDAFVFSSLVQSGQPYSVTVFANPTAPISQTCTVTNGSGTVGNGDVTDIQVSCTTNAFTIGGTVTGLVGGGLVLQNNGGDNLPISGDGPFELPTAITSGTNYAVTVQAQPTLPWQTCSVSGGTGTVGNADVTSVVVTCTTNDYSIGGMLSGLATGNSLTLRNNGGDDLILTSSGSFTFPTKVASGRPYAVTVVANPTGPISQTCRVVGGSGTVAGGPVTDVRVLCLNSYAIGGTLTGLAGGNSITLRNNGGDDVALTSNSNFTFPTPVTSGQPYAVTVVANPTTPISQTCMVTNGSGIVGGAPVTNVQVACTTSTFTIGGTVTGLTGTGLVLRNNGGDDLSTPANGPFEFQTPVASGAAYNVTIRTQPSGEPCGVAGGTGTVGASNVTTVRVSCGVWSPSQFPITVPSSSGYGDITLDNNNDLLVVANVSRAIVRVNRVTGAQTTVATGISSGVLLGVAYRAENDMIYASSFDNRIYAVTPTGAVSLLATLPGALWAIAIAPPSFGSYGGFIIGVVYGGPLIAVDPANGAVTTIVSNIGPASDLAFAPDGTLYVSGGDSITGTVRRVTATGGVTQVAGGFRYADGITVTPDGTRMFIADSDFNIIYQVTIPNAVVTPVATASLNLGTFVSGIVAAPGNTLIALTFGGTLRAFTY